MKRHSPFRYTCNEGQVPKRTRVTSISFFESVGGGGETEIFPSPNRSQAKPPERSSHAPSSPHANYACPPPNPTPFAGGSISRWGSNLLHLWHVSLRLARRAGTAAGSHCRARAHASLRSHARPTHHLSIASRGRTPRLRFACTRYAARSPVRTRCGPPLAPPPASYSRERVTMRDYGCTLGARRRRGVARAGQSGAGVCRF